MAKGIYSIDRALESDPVDIVALRKLAISPGGLIDRKYRRLVWPHLLNVAGKVCEKPEDVRSHRECEQVCLDVFRSRGRFPLNMPDKERLKLQEELTDLILSVLTLHPELHYYQGYHDICVTFLLVCGSELALPLVERLSTHHLRDFMDPTMHSTTNILNYLIPLLDKANPNLKNYILESGVDMVFAISWLITWFSYVLDSQSDIERLCDFFLACHPLMPVYFAAQLVSLYSEEIMNGECEMARVYKSLLDTARKDDLPLEDLVKKTSDFYIQYPPSSLAELAEFYKDDLAVSTFCDFALVADHDLPDEVRQRKLGKVENGPSTTKTASPSPSATIVQNNYWSLVGVAATAVGGAVGAVVITIVNNASEWVPDLLSYL